MRLTDEQAHQALSELIKRKKISKSDDCPHCGGKMGIQDTVYSIPSFSDPNIGMPTLAICCGSCGYMELFNAIHLGVMKTH